ncbi:MAG: metalloregulator ArsR/SmtB family transcription factor [Bdellovibrionales bacterium]|jgi:DNA-binding transcriptional ArsR family regulator|nr:metalloregulator ArsR/SmtB family transcription factor [Bdellovibrionales bacterium]
MAASKQTSVQDMKKNAVAASSFLKNIANPSRLTILCLLTQGEMCVTDLLDHLDISQTALSQHLARLRAEEIVGFRREHRTLYYFIQNQNVAVIISALYDIYCAPQKPRK